MVFFVCGLVLAIEGDWFVVGLHYLQHSEWCEARVCLGTSQGF